MKTFNYKTLAVALGTSLLLIGSLNVYAADYSGSFEGTISKQDGLPIDLTGQHVIALGLASGTNKSTGNMDYFNGGAIVVTDTVDIVNGNGTHSGYWTVSQNGETVTNKLTGKMTTVMAADGKTPMTSIEGTFANVYGTGVHATIHPIGTYKATFTSATTYVSEWEVTGFE